MASRQQELDALVAEVRFPVSMRIVIAFLVFAVPLGPGSGKNGVGFPRRVP